MSLGTIAFNKEVFNLDHMTSEQHSKKEKMKIRKELKKLVKYRSLKLGGKSGEER